MFLVTGCENKKRKILNIGILQFMEHNCLDESRQGFIKGLEENGYKDGENIKIDYQNASGEQSNCNQIGSKFKNENKDLILAIGTPAAQSLANMIKDTPILITAVTNPAESGLVNSNEKPGKNVTGTSDLNPPEKQIKLIKKILPNAKNVAVFYSSGEVNSKIQAELAVKECEKIDLKPIIYTVSNPTEIESIINSMNKNKIDVIFVPTDNLIVSAMPHVSQTATRLKIPIICSEENSVKNGALGTYSISYFELGRITALQAIKILKKETLPENMAIEYLKDSKLIINFETLEKLKIEISDNLKEELK
jgi:putative ABC transport system substrate-binding protein